MLRSLTLRGRGLLGKLVFSFFVAEQGASQPGTIEKMQGTMRLFFALWPSPEEQILFLEAARDFREILSGRWIARERIHLTLLFLPSVEEGQLGPLFSLVERPRLPGVVLRLDRLVFQPAGKEGLLWLAPAAASRSLEDLVEELQAGLIALGLFAGERRPFSPHITLARRVLLPRRSGVGRRRPVVLHHLPRPIDWPVREMALVCSESSPEGSRYTALASWALPVSAETNSSCFFPGKFVRE
ncbi:RNA 2',3'-cyclic phosphodiesterase [Methylacidimicrobium cyclopophantes]|uniref:RNA 2',3'-cyclic phosphodiesterase n=1 Tax=Methylacidimicrobium cyclopophantes TaxID=1041766 RepID=A0A5E6MAX1_9BACT|nr:RNA 2',3'-cyclic phosphodiesterase [Methylacidimicrobium cyclopophantes]VVM06358.1 RNA 2',3'-cyclic phosphodiesterase [Methylacidimicrobium cyclopophantes]